MEMEVKIYSLPRFLCFSRFCSIFANIQHLLLIYSTIPRLDYITIIIVMIIISYRGRELKFSHFTIRTSLETLKSLKIA